jgi:hypothetical protein
MVAHGVFFKDFEKLFPADNQNVIIPFMVSGIEMTNSCRNYGSHFKVLLLILKVPFITQV